MKYYFFVGLLLIPILVLPAYGKEGAIQCANLIYGNNMTSRCFSDEFLSEAQRKTTIPTARRFKSSKLSSEDLFKFPFAMMTGEKTFQFSKKETENLNKYLSSGGFLLASAGCSNKDWDKAFRREMKLVFPDNPLTKIPETHPVYGTVNKVKKLNLKRPEAEANLFGIELNGKLVLIYSPHGLNNTSNTEGCCCCGGNEILNSLEINVNILVYALLH